MSDDRELPNVEGDPTIDPRIFDTPTDATVSEPSADVPVSSVPPQVESLPDPSGTVESPVMTPENPVLNDVPPAPQVPTVDTSDAPPLTDSSGTPIWSDVTDTNAPSADAPAASVPDSSGVSPVPVISTPETSVPTTVPVDAPVVVTEVPDVAQTSDDDPGYYKLGSNGLPDLNVPLFGNDVVEFLNQFLAEKFPDDYAMAKLRFVLRKNFERDDDRSHKE